MCHRFKTQRPFKTFAKTTQHTPSRPQKNHSPAFEKCLRVASLRHLHPAGRR